MLSRVGKMSKIGECTKVKKCHIWAFLELICNQVSLSLPLCHHPSAPHRPYHQPRQGMAQRSSLE